MKLIGIVIYEEDICSSLFKMLPSFRFTFCVLGCKPETFYIEFNVVFDYTKNLRFRVRVNFCQVNAKLKELMSSLGLV